MWRFSGTYPFRFPPPVMKGDMCPGGLPYSLPHHVCAVFSSQVTDSRLTTVYGTFRPSRMGSEQLCCLPTSLALLTQGEPSCMVLRHPIARLQGSCLVFPCCCVAAPSLSGASFCCQLPVFLRVNSSTPRHLRSIGMRLLRCVAGKSFTCSPLRVNSSASLPSEEPSWPLWCPVLATPRDSQR